MACPSVAPSYPLTRREDQGAIREKILAVTEFGEGMALGSTLALESGDRGRGRGKTACRGGWGTMSPPVARWQFGRQPRKKRCNCWIVKLLRITWLPAKREKVAGSPARDGCP